MDNLAVTDAGEHACATGFEADAQSLIQQIAAESLELFRIRLAANH